MQDQAVCHQMIVLDQLAVIAGGGNKLVEDSLLVLTAGRAVSLTDTAEQVAA